MSKIIEHITKGLQSLDLADDDLKRAYRDATELECIALDQIKTAVVLATQDAKRLLHAIGGGEE